MKVKENISYGLKMHGYSKKEQDSRAQELMEMLSISHIGDQYRTVLPEPVRPRIAKISPIWMVREMGDSVKLPLFTEKLLITSWFIV